MSYVQDQDVEAALIKFDGYRQSMLPEIGTREHAEGRTRYETVIRLNDQWLTRYSGPHGYARMLDLRERGGGNLPLHVLREKIDLAEDGLLQIAERFVTECKRLELGRG
jgi:hypothetical protein